MKRNRLGLLALSASMLVAPACTKNQIATPLNEKVETPSIITNSSTGTLVFETSFDNSEIVPDGSQYDEISGTNVAGSGWTTSAFGNKFRFAYEAGVNTDRKAEVLNEGATSNKVLRYIIKNAAILNTDPQKARVQANVYGMKDPATNYNFREIYQSVRFKLHFSSFNKILGNDDILNGSSDWLTISEFWNNNDWDETYPFRISINLRKHNGKFAVYAKAQKYVGTKWETGYSWQSTLDKTIELDEWNTMEVYFKEGLQNDPDVSKRGKFYLAITPPSGIKKVICDFATGTNSINTYDPSDPTPDGISQWNPMKLYTSKNVIDAIKAGENPQQLQIFWDDYKLWRDKQPQ